MLLRTAPVSGSVGGLLQQVLQGLGAKRGRQQVAAAARWSGTSRPAGANKWRRLIGPRIRRPKHFAYRSSSGSPPGSPSLEPSVAFRSIESTRDAAKMRSPPASRPARGSSRLGQLERIRFRAASSWASSPFQSLNSSLIAQLCSRSRLVGELLGHSPGQWPTRSRQAGPSVGQLIN